ncbi:hypothetical protein OMP38_07680 [Cohnella ginsengisoli]|uniref:Uncharacterized protein n=1 Tax=Cohnella ginsengisoli TaxID=425004 RepID=A0A9X4KEX1_9BACL|nr:hypothetical protein [Cohnella ginsengisoli]MDG0790751.1 hypothetical protein [Cohnella ginsengisoli]
MYSALNGLAACFTLMLLAFAWTAGNRAGKLRWFGSAERLSRKSRKLLTWTALATLSAIGAGAAVWLLARSSDDALPFGRASLQMALIALPIGAVWLTALPRAWRLWRGAARLQDEPVPAPLATSAASAALVAPYRAAAYGAGASLAFYAPAAWGAAAPVFAYAVLFAALWMLRRRRIKPSAAPIPR